MQEANKVNTSKNTADDIPEKLGDVASKYGLFKCDKAADAMKKLLLKKKEHGQVIQIKYPTWPGYVRSISNDEIISKNGVHMGIVYKNKVYCNIHPYGLPIEEWINDFE